MGPFFRTSQHEGRASVKVRESDPEGVVEVLPGPTHPPTYLPVLDRERPSPLGPGRQTKAQDRSDIRRLPLPRLRDG